MDEWLSRREAASPSSVLQGWRDGDGDGVDDGVDDGSFFARLARWCS